MVIVMVVVITTMMMKMNIIKMKNGKVRELSHVALFPPSTTSPREEDEPRCSTVKGDIRAQLSATNEGFLFLCVSKLSCLMCAEAPTPLFL